MWALIVCCSSYSNGSITECEDKIQAVSIAGNNPTKEADSKIMFKSLWINYKWINCEKWIQAYGSTCWAEEK